jgi:RNA polymerase sigma-70 factor (ECF subfamily)
VTVDTQVRGVVAAARPDDEEDWVADLTADGPLRDLALQRLHRLLLGAARRQVWRLRDLLPGAGPRDLEDLAMQAADEALVTILRKLDDFEGRSRFTTWAYKFGVFQAGVEVRRQAWRNREVTLPDRLATLDRAPSPAELAEASELARALEDAITMRLSPHQRRVVLALLVDDVPIDVLADRLGSTRNALYKTLHDARTRLRRSLVSQGYLDAPNPGRIEPS